MDDGRMSILDSDLRAKTGASMQVEDADIGRRARVMLWCTVPCDLQCKIIRYVLSPPSLSKVVGDWTGTTRRGIYGKYLENISPLRYLILSNRPKFCFANLLASQTITDPRSSPWRRGWREIVIPWAKQSAAGSQIVCPGCPGLGSGPAKGPNKHDGESIRGNIISCPR
ncbi:hypothetical protein B0F90DRAFT_248236 [Multifurca ochricompacta]|uniref:Uncharacterized protein n=1 Tax=Multifurca ochricompacta TaxID=376703 RepID=A0AAD4M4K8_9AGAM|nr:hypothetical protein B0F90DRAFT_248236 [Multifurca ochricompacta]